MELGCFVLQATQHRPVNCFKKMKILSSKNTKGKINRKKEGSTLMLHKITMKNIILVQCHIKRSRKRTSRILFSEQPITYSSGNEMVYKTLKEN
jgi:hypothetical protein